MKNDILHSIGAAVLVASILGTPGCDRPADTGQAATPTPAPTTLPPPTPPPPPPPSPTPVDPATELVVTPPPDSSLVAPQPPAALPADETPSRPELAPPPAPSEPSGPPLMSFASNVFDFGRIPETEKHLVRLGFTNMGAEQLVIDEVKTSCGCTAAQLMKRTYGGGESGYIEISYKPSAPGEQKQTVNVFTNGSAQPVRLLIQADVEAFIQLEPRMLRLGSLPYGRAYRTAVAVWSPPDENFRIVNARMSNPNVSARILPENEAIRYPIEGADPNAEIIEVEISADAPWGGLVSWLDVTVTAIPKPGALPITHNSKVRIMADMFGALEAQPNTVRFGVKPGEAFERKIRLSRPDGAPLVIQSATVDVPGMPGASVAIERVAANETDLVFTATGPERMSQYNGRVLVRTDVVGEEEIVIPVVGVVRKSPAGVR